jgi:hypothetical protein
LDFPPGLDRKGSSRNQEEGSRDVAVALIGEAPSVLTVLKIFISTGGAFAVHFSGMVIGIARRLTAGNSHRTLNLEA